MAEVDYPAKTVPEFIGLMPSPIRARSMLGRPAPAPIGKARRTSTGGGLNCKLIRWRAAEQSKALDSVAKRHQASFRSLPCRGRRRAVSAARMKPGRTPERYPSGLRRARFPGACAHARRERYRFDEVCVSAPQTLRLLHLRFSGRTRSGDDGNALLLLRFLRGARSSWQLQHSRLLTLTEAGEQYNRPVGKLECVVMHVQLFLLDLPAPRHLLPEPPVREET